MREHEIAFGCTKAEVVLEVESPSYVSDWTGGAPVEVGYGLERSQAKGASMGLKLGARLGREGPGGEAEVSLPARTSDKKSSASFHGTDSALIVVKDGDNVVRWNYDMLEAARPSGRN